MEYLFSESSFKSLVKKIINEQNTLDSTTDVMGGNMPMSPARTYASNPNVKHTKKNPLRPAKDPYEYAYENNIIWVKRRNEPNWKNITQGKIDGLKNYETYYNDIVNTYGNILGIVDKNRVVKTGLENSVLYDAISPSHLKYCGKTQLNPNKSNTITNKYNNYQCAQFVNNFSDKIEWLGSAWRAHNNDKIGARVWSAFHNLSNNNINKITNLFSLIHKNGGGVKDGKYLNECREIVDNIVPSTCPVDLKVGDVVGIFYPSSHYHEVAFMQGGYNYENYSYFLNNGKAITGTKLKDIKNGVLTPGATIKSGKGWGMNTHIGIVGEEQNNIPFIYHNIGTSKTSFLSEDGIGTLYADPVNHLFGNGRVAWVRRP